MPCAVCWLQQNLANDMVDVRARQKYPDKVCLSGAQQKELWARKEASPTA
jgi:hypothetical protein